ncbi:hypothetical protein ACVITL_006803 [Rhizobium pisi]
MRLWLSCKPTPRRASPITLSPMVPHLCNDQHLAEIARHVADDAHAILMPTGNTVDCCAGILKNSDHSLRAVRSCSPRQLRVKLNVAAEKRDGLLGIRLGEPLKSFRIREDFVPMPAVWLSRNFQCRQSVVPLKWRNRPCPKRIMPYQRWAILKSSLSIALTIRKSHRSLTVAKARPEIQGRHRCPTPTANGTIRKDPPTVVNPHGDRVRRAGTRKAPPPSGTAWRRRPASVLLAFEAAFCRRVINSDFSKGERLELMSLEPTFWVRSFSRH